MARKYVAPTFSYPTKDVFAAAVRAHNVNQGYQKEAVCKYAPEDTEMRNPIVTPRNLDFMREYLTSAVEFTEEEYAEATSIIDYYQGKLMELMSDKLNSYSQAACQVANKEKIESLIEIGLIASLPKAWRNSVVFDKMLDAKERAFSVSKIFGAKGDPFEGRVKVISSVYSQKWFRYFHTAQDLATGNVVNFSSGEKLELNEELNIRGRIKDHVDGKVTRLNYVKIIIAKNIVDSTN